MGPKIKIMKCENRLEIASFLGDLFGNPRIPCQLGCVAAESDACILHILEPKKTKPQTCFSFFLGTHFLAGWPFHFQVQAFSNTY